MLKLPNEFHCVDFATHESKERKGLVEVNLSLVTTFRDGQDPAQFYRQLREIIASRKIQLVTGREDANNS